MKTHRTLPSLFLAISLIGALQAAESPSDVIKEWVAAINTNDAERFLSFYDRSEELVVTVSSRQRHEGFEALAKAFREDLASVRFRDSSATAMRTRLLGDAAAVAFEHRFKIEVSGDKSRWQAHVQTTSVLRRFEGAWKIVAEHSSPIRGIERMTRIED